MFDDLFQLVRTHFGTDDFIPLHEPRFSELDKKYVADAIDSTFVSSVGGYVDRFENELAERLGAKRAVATVNGTSALQVALRLVGVQPGDEVLTQALTFVATANAIAYNGAHPVFLDVDRGTMGLSPDAVGSFLEEHAEKRADGVFNQVSGRRIAAIVPMHTFGLPIRIEELCALAEEWGIPVVEDAAEALGSTCQGKPCGTFGQIGVFSFNGNKTITCGGGGAIVTNDEMLADRAKYLTTTAKVPHRWEFVHDEIGYNYRMPNLNAALACAQLEQVDHLLADKRELATAYRKFFKTVDWADYVDEPEGCKSNFWLNAILLPDSKVRNDFLEVSNSAGIMTRPIWKPMNELKMYSHCQCEPLENSKWLEQRVVNIPSSARKRIG
jgi:aminotransferase in exopolysaccharide biosynthesis